MKRSKLPWLNLFFLVFWLVPAHAYTPRANFSDLPVPGPDGVIHLTTPGQSYIVRGEIPGLSIEAPDIVVRGRGAQVLGDVELIAAKRAKVDLLAVRGRIQIKNSSKALVSNSWASALLVEGGENVTVFGNVITGGCNFISSNGITITGQICSTMFLGGSPSAPFTNSTIRYNIIRNTLANLDGQPGDLSRGRMSEILGAADMGDNLNGPCPFTHHLVEYNYFEGNHQGGAHDDEPFVFRMRCAKGTASAQNILRYNTFKSNGIQVGVYFRDHVDFMLFEGNSVIVNNPAFHSAMLFGSGNDGTYSDDPSDNVIRKNFFSSETPVTATIYLQGFAGNSTFQENVIRAGASRPALSMSLQANGPNRFEHNTFVSGGAQTIFFDRNPANSMQVFSYNIISPTGSAPFGFDHGAAASYQGDHNLFYNPSGSVSIPSQDSAARTGDPVFLIPAAPTYDFRIGATSPARQAGADTSDRGAFQYNQSCTGAWSCSNWSSCISGQEIRICPGLNDCGQPNPLPYQTRTCGSGGTPSPDTLAPSAPTGLVVN